jgi:hypothetical protein
VQTIALSLWLGAAALFVSSVAPAAFAVMPSRALAGALVGRVLPALFYAGIGVGVAVMALEFAAGRPMLRGRSMSGAFVIVACAAAQFVIGTRIDRLRQDIGGSLEGLAADDLRRVAFGRLHGASVALLGVAMLAAVIALILSMRALQPRS